MYYHFTAQNKYYNRRRYFIKEICSITMKCFLVLLPPIKIFCLQAIYFSISVYYFEIVCYNKIVNILQIVEAINNEI